MNAAVDACKIAIISREAGHVFTPNYQAQQAGQQGEFSTKESRARVTQTGRSALIKRIKFGDPGLSTDRRASHMLFDKETPHIIAVIEGLDDVADSEGYLSLNQGPTRGESRFKILAKHQGKNAAGGNDAKQNFFILVRSDLEDVYHAAPVDVPHESQTIPCMGVNYETEDGRKYQTLIVHIPHKFLGNSAKEGSTHDAFKQYAVSMAGETTVTGYIGDTNYSKPMTHRSNPSTAGFERQAGGWAAELNPRASGAQSEKHFMQHVPLGTPEGVSVLQPSTLHPVKVGNDQESRTRPGIDHPSIMGRIVHNSLLKGRPPESVIML
ncbi:hypothetical protein [Nisaea sp.]|uniref:hypothetical protein n=1 Tax=Nisaea sp. TaxID=2024842 RepID=UPI0032644AF1